MASNMEVSAASAASHVCSHCKKAFARLCDLNKHAKSHSRPYKCQVVSCKYHEHGWPTAKELERHINDKHSLSPKTYACLYQPCAYRSKRESNCKQHMEKAHKWNYVRSKSNGKRLSDQSPEFASYHLTPEDVSMVDRSPSGSSISPQPFLGPQPGMDFVLFDDQADAYGEDDDDSSNNYTFQNQAPDTYIPWTSPTTRVRKAENFIQEFTQTYNGVLNTKPADGSFQHDALLDPRLAYHSPLSIQTYQSSDDHSVIGEPIIKMESPITSMKSYSPIKRKYEPMDGTSQESKPSSTPAYESAIPRQASLATRAPSKTPSSHRRESFGEDSRRPDKRPRIDPTENFTDTNMPDIFRYAHPHIYDRDQKETFSPCHTLHRDISTLVRHLSRPAHKFNVTDRYISSFDQEEGYPHPRVGVCRWCWKTFPDRPSFFAHVSCPCEKVSKGKREKWRVLLESFTPLVSDVVSPSHEGSDLVQESEEEGWRQLSQGLESEDGGGQVCRSPPTSVPSPTILYPAATPGTVAFVPVNEHRRLQKEHEQLREQHQLLGQVAKVLVARQLEEKKQPLDPRTSMLLAAISASASSSKPGDSVSVSGNSDQDNLVQHMDSQRTDHVDIQGLMEEVDEVHKTLSRQNSGMSTASKSTVHHVRNSPPPFSVAGAGAGGCTSHADSGYGTEHNNNGGKQQQQQLTAVEEGQHFFGDAMVDVDEGHNTFMMESQGGVSTGTGVAYDGGFELMVNDDDMGVVVMPGGFDDFSVVADTFEFGLGN
ncbi:hypothetical protein QBC38DRAFT_363513 [Podospora fimiseda]|uniref:C2H2-type domain-containing protein n=1 Tax=Podospora fimiseda TaxID=252190 RepID=A0AAN7BQM4_9PEZI|nr:hypothetical protein QBC38DRAFT_363513 [Podospora fimiseda]